MLSNLVQNLLVRKYIVAIGWSFFAAKNHLKENVYVSHMQCVRVESLANSIHDNVFQQPWRNGPSRSELNLHNKLPYAIQSCYKSIGQ